MSNSSTCLVVGETTLLGAGSPLPSSTTKPTGLTLPCGFLNGVSSNSNGSAVSKSVAVNTSQTLPEAGTEMLIGSSCGDLSLILNSAAETSDGDVNKNNKSWKRRTAQVITAREKPRT